MLVFNRLNFLKRVLPGSLFYFLYISIFLSFFVSVVEAAPWQYVIQTQVAQFDYVEFDESNDTLNQEDGILYGIRLSAKYRQRKWFAELRVEASSSVVNYSGKTNQGDYEHSNTGTIISNVLMDFGLKLQDGASYSNWLTVGMGSRWWRRDIYSTPRAFGLLEHYNWPYWQFGVLQNFMTPKVKVNLLLAYRLVFLPHLYVDFKNQYQSVDFESGATYGIKGSLSFQLYKQRYQPFFVITVNLWESDASARHTVPNTNIMVHEPASETSIYAIGIGLKY